MEAFFIVKAFLKRKLNVNFLARPALVRPMDSADLVWPIPVPAYLNLFGLFGLIWAYLGLFETYLDLFWAYLGLFGLIWAYFVFIWNDLGLIRAYLGDVDSLFEFIWAYLVSKNIYFTKVGLHSW